MSATAATPEVVTHIEAQRLPEGSLIVHVQQPSLLPTVGAPVRRPAELRDMPGGKYQVLYRAPEPPKPLSVGDIIEEASDLARLPVESVLKCHGMKTAIRQPDEDGCAFWSVSGHGALFRPSSVPLPAVVLYVSGAS